MITRIKTYFRGLETSSDYNGAARLTSVLIVVLFGLLAFFINLESYSRLTQALSFFIVGVLISINIFYFDYLYRKNKKEELDVVFASSNIIDSVSEEVNQILDCLATLLKSPGLRHAWCSDLTKICDFLPSEIDNTKTVPHPLDKSIQIPISTFETPENIALLAQASIELDIDLKSNDLLYEAALRLKEKKQ